ncbi:hypothetical protein SLS62_009907 [Diatrype stigma]|uniref:Uncharacterized protein n=1 Tax=Diatrype stigma TaxID=117547 RepID=A0AAN9UBG8_9PEZI
MIDQLIYKDRFISMISVISDRALPSSSIQYLPASSAFALTDEEMAQSTHDIALCLARAAAIINRGRSLSIADCSEAFGAIKEALIPAYDEAACDAVPWAQCHLYLGHIARALRRLPEAEDAYAEAASTLSDDPAEQDASEEAAANLVHLQKKRKDERRKGRIWANQPLEEPSSPSIASGKSRSQRLHEFLHATWNPEGDLHIQRMPVMRRRPVTVTPTRNAIRYPDGGDSEVRGGPPRLRRTSSRQVHGSSEY